MRDEETTEEEQRRIANETTEDTTENYTVMNRLDVAENELQTAINQGNFTFITVVPRIQNVLEELDKIRETLAG